MIEDKAVDLYVLERAISSTHPEASELFALILEAYADNLDISTGKSILNKLAEGNWNANNSVNFNIFLFSTIER